MINITKAFIFFEPYSSSLGCETNVSIPFTEAKKGATWVLDKHFFLVCKCETTTSNANASKTMSRIYFMWNILIFTIEEGILEAKTECYDKDKVKSSPFFRSSYNDF